MPIICQFSRIILSRRTGHVSPVGLVIVESSGPGGAGCLDLPCLGGGPSVGAC